MDHNDGGPPRLHVFLGTKAQYIKTAPLLRLLDAQSIPYRLIDSGQHGALAVGLRDELGVRAPDHVLGDGRDVETIRHAVVWALRLAWLLVRPGRLRRDVFAVGDTGGDTGGDAGGDRGGDTRGATAVCIVHGDTPSTLLGALLARRIGLRVAHLEAGLTSGRLWDPIPEEAIRRLVMRLSHLLFAPDEVAVAHLQRMRVKGRVVPVGANTVVEATAHALEVAGEAHEDRDGTVATGPALVTMHRVENLKSPPRVQALVDLVVEQAAASAAGHVQVGQTITFVLHGPTEPVLRRAGHLDRLREAGVTLLPLQPHGDFVRMLAAAPWVITDGGSIQEECALLGVPTLLWRQRSERPDGIGENVVVSEHDADRVRAFLADPQALRRPRRSIETTPSARVLAELLEAVGGA